MSGVVDASLRRQHFCEAPGFEAIRAPCDEDGIPHVGVRRRGRA